MRKPAGFRAPWEVSPMSAFCPLPDGALGDAHPSASRPASAKPEDFTIVVDTREQTPLQFQPNVPTVRATLHQGDYSVLGYEDRFAVERKSLDDLVNTVIHSRDRFARELVRLSRYGFRAVFVTSPFSHLVRHRYHSRALPQAVEAICDSLAVRHGVQFMFWDGPDEAARRLVSIARHWVRAERIRAASRVPCPPPPKVEIGGDV